MEQYALADQLRRSSKGICANLAEDLPNRPTPRRNSPGSFRWPWGHAAETWISYAFDLEYITEAQRDEWLQSYAHIYGMLVNLREKLK